MTQMPAAMMVAAKDSLDRYAAVRATFVKDGSGGAPTAHRVTP